MNTEITGNKFSSIVNLDSLSEKQKESIDYFKLQMSIKIAQSNNIDKLRLFKAYRTRYGIRDLNEFDHITAKYGHDFPATLTHTPLIDRHVKFLESQIDVTPLDYYINATDANSIDKINKEKINSILNKIEDDVKANLGKDENEQKKYFHNRYIDELQKQHDKTFTSILQKQSKAVLDNEIEFLQLKRKFSRVFSDIATCGEGYFQDRINNDGSRFTDRISPLEFYYIKNSNQQFASESDAFVRKHWMLISDVIIKYGHKLKSEEIELLYKLYNYNSFNYYSSYVQFYTEGYVSNYDSFNNFTYNPSQNTSFAKYILIQEVEWKSPNKVKGSDRYRLDRYHGIRIGRDIYVDCEKDINVQRSTDNPYYCGLSVEGILFDEYENKGRSIFLDTKDLADDYDIYNFYLQNAIALSGNKVITVPTTAIPIEFGNSHAERLLEHQRYLRMGYNYINPTQEGANFNNYGAAIDLSLGAGIKILIDILAMLEERASLITGVSRQNLAQITQQDGKGTTEIAVTQTTLLIQKLFFTYNQLIKRCLTNVINNSRIDYKLNNRSNYVLGEQKDIFSLNKDFFVADYNVFIVDSTSEKKQLDEFKQLSFKMIDNQMINAIDGINIFSSHSLTEVKEKLIESVESQKADITNELKQELEQIKKENQKLTGDLQKLNQIDLNNDKIKLDIEKEKVDNESELQNRQLEIEEKYKNQMLELEKKRVELEQLQIEFSNKSIEVKNK